MVSWNGRKSEWKPLGRECAQRWRALNDVADCAASGEVKEAMEEAAPFRHRIARHVAWQENALARQTEALHKLILLHEEILPVYNVNSMWDGDKEMAEADIGGLGGVGIEATNDVPHESLLDELVGGDLLGEALAIECQ